MNEHPKAFFAYPAANKKVADIIRLAISSFNKQSKILLECWEKNDISGIPIIYPIISKISECTFLAADITYLNENVAYEIGFAIGSKKRCILFFNSTERGDIDLASDIGIFDTLGYERYDTSVTLSELLLSRNDFNPLEITQTINRQQPLYVVEPNVKNEFHLKLMSRTKKARLRYRSFNPDEDVRLSALDAIKHVSESSGVITPLFPANHKKSREHNIRAMFVAGISAALDVPTLIIHKHDYTPPLDVRDVTKKYKSEDDIVDAVHEFSLEVTDYLQRTKDGGTRVKTQLTDLSIGDPTAENEMTTLGNYYLHTDEYQRALRGEVNLVVGRKGSGKTALFVQLRDNMRSSRHNIVVDLKPEGFQLVKLKERLLDFLNVGAQQHLITAFWEYVLLLEIAYKILEKDNKIYMRDHQLTEFYLNLSKLYGKAELAQEGDFRERLSNLSDHIIHEFFKFAGSMGDLSKRKEKLNLTTANVTEILYRHDIRSVYDSLISYLKLKNDVWLLFDNIDKGWNVDGISDIDIVILRCLINASRKIEREFKGKGIKFHSVIFVRDDVYGHLMDGSADYGKEMRVSLDWSDIDLLCDVLTKRIGASLNSGDREHVMNICVSHYKGVPWIEFMANMALMRPRNLLKLFKHCLAYANNLRHERIEPEDISKGWRTYSHDLIIEVDRELADIYPQAKKLMYEFFEESTQYTHDDMLTLFQIFGLNIEIAERVLKYLIYCGVIGVGKTSDDVFYIYQVNYDMDMINAKIRKSGNSLTYFINPALWPALNYGGS